MKIALFWGGIEKKKKGRQIEERDRKEREERVRERERERDTHICPDIDRLLYIP